jgi:hypothetical protein
MSRIVFTVAEKQFVLDQVERHLHILESKKTDLVSVTRKKKIWEKIFRDYNSVESHSKVSRRVYRSQSSSGPVYYSCFILGRRRPPSS